jgi:uncharacterized protein
MYPFASLPENLVAFADALRRHHGFHLGPRELADSARALTAISLGDERIVRDVLRPILCHTLQDLAVFDRAFTSFFYPARASSGVEGVTRPLASPGNRVRGELPDAEAFDDISDGASSTTTGPRAELDALQDETREPEDVTCIGLRYSPLEGEGDPPELVPPDADERGAARAVVNRLQRGLSRRWHSAPRGRRFDLRRTLRGSLHTGGEAVVPRWRARVRRRPRLVVIVDGSRSMGADALAALRVTTALASATRNLEAFTFSTELRRITPDVRRVSAGERHRLAFLHHAWGGGTSLGTCLHEFLRRHGDRLIDGDTVVMIASDGLDVGDPLVLRDTMARLHRRSAGIVWLNPLTQTDGYEPTAAGMYVARPFVTALDWAGDAAGLLKLSRTIRLRA